MNKVDKIISVLYLAKSDNREKMLSDLIQNILYNVNSPTDIDTVIDFVNNNFHLNPIKYEVQECIESLLDKNEICIKDGKYCLTEPIYDRIHGTILKGQGESEKRFESFTKIVHDIFEGSLSREEVNRLWTIFNEYLLECFMVFGRKAIDIFLPYKQDHLEEDNDIIKEALKKLHDDKLVTIFKKLILEYPERLTEAELRYLSGLATRAEKFYSLGMEKLEYEKVKNLQIKDLVILIDTNILYSILDLRVHPENAAIFELIRIAKEKLIDLRIVYLPKTFKELQKVRSYLDKLIAKEKFRPAQIKALLASEKLDSFARKYYQSKLVNSDLPHPGEKVTYASEFLKSRGINIYNSRFPDLEDDTRVLNKRIVEYMDFQKYYNNLCEERGYEFYLNKDDKKIEHDVFLREAIRILKSKYSEENELRFICLTLDRSLIHFDRYSLKRELMNSHKSINPNFILPSIFIKKIRPFIPISTNNYRKAFISSLTAPNLEKDDDKESVAIQKTMTYFKNLGIDDEEIIINCIKREMFLEEVVVHEKDNTVDDFIKTEITKEIERIREEKESLEREIETKETYSQNLLKAKEEEKAEIIKSKEEEKEKIKKDKEKKVQKLENRVASKDEQIVTLERRLRAIESEREAEKEEKIKEQERNAFELSLVEWKSNRDKFIAECWIAEIPLLRKDMAYFLFVLMATILPIIVGFLLKANTHIIDYVERKGINQWYIWGVLTVIFLIELFGRAYIFNKEKIKNGFFWFLAFFSKKVYNKIMADKKSVYFELYVRQSGQEPRLQNEGIGT